MIRQKVMNNHWKWICVKLGANGTDERGIALITVILLVMVLSFVSATAIVISTTELKIGSNYKTSIQAFYAAEAGLAHAKQLLSQLVTTSGTTINTILAGNKNTSTSLMLDPTPTAILLAPTNSLFPKFVYNPTFSGGSYYVYISNDKAETGGLTSIVDTNKIITLTSVGYGPNRSSAVVQATYKISNGGVTNTPGSGAGAFLGNHVTFYGGASMLEFIGGGLTTTTTAPRTTISGTATVPQYSIGTEWPFDSPQHLQDYYTQLKTVANGVGNYYNGTNPANYSNPNQAPLVVNGNLTLGNNKSGSGILVVTGILTVGNSFDWHGLILVIGEGDFRWGSHLAITGGLVVASVLPGNINDNTNIPNTWGDVQGVLNVGGGGGSSTITYDNTQWNNTTQSTSSQNDIGRSGWKQF